MHTTHTTPGRHEPLGATWDGAGTNFALYSEGATAVTLCLFDEAGVETRVPLLHRTEFVWHVYVQGVAPGARYGYRVDGPWEPTRGLRFNAKNILLDPYARSLHSTEHWERGAFSYDLESPDKDLAPATTNQAGAPLGIVTDETFDWGDDAPPNTPLRNTFIYEAHIKGLTMRHPDVPAHLRGTYLGVSADPIVRHLKKLGVTALEILPIHGFADDGFLVSKGLRNYWGYNSIAFFAPDVRYRVGEDRGAEVWQFKRMVKALHAAGIEVILDVVYNHTAEGNHLGPTLSFRGIDNTTYYRLVADSPRYYFDYTGTGNSINVLHPQVLRLIMDSLRYWVLEMHVDGFRFDLASTLARGLYEVDRLSSFFTIIHQDPVINKVKLIAEPWDLGNGGYQVGRFPLRWSEWNGRYRDTVREFWRGDGGRVADLGYRLTGSSDLYQRGGRRPASSVNFIAAHDGFTMRDIVTYAAKHNEANGEENRDGTDDNASWNCGIEGPTDDPSVRAARLRHIKNMLATLFLSQGVPMLAAGDEMGRTQGGNNNAYCQDNEISWLDWSLDDDNRALLEFTERLVLLRRSHPLIERATFFGGREIRGLGAPDIVWFRRDGAVMTDEDWSSPHATSLGVFMAGSGLDPVDERGRLQTDDDLVLLFNSAGADAEFVLPRFVERGEALAWTAVVDTAVDRADERVEPGSGTFVRAQSLKLFARRALGPGGLQAAYGVPVSTYRLQLQRLGFEGARATLDYLVSLGVGGVYTSPYLRAEHGSTHGYNVVDHSSLHPELGTLEEYRAFTDAMRERGLSHVADFVPNHVGIGTGENAWFGDVLENGPSSLYADFFDIDWAPPTQGLVGRLLLPVLGRQFGQEVNDGNIGIRRDGGRLHVTYYERRLPACPRSYVAVLTRARTSAALPSSDPRAQELESILASLHHLPLSSVTEPRARLERARERDVILRRLASLCDDAEVAHFIDTAVREISKNPGWLEEFLNAQNYRLSYWKVATEEINYRRFFDVNELAAIRMEDPRVFGAAHALLLDLIREGRITALRLDHIDGLFDPAGYLRTLQTSVREALQQGGVPSSAPMYVVAEKILEPGEEMPQEWALSGSTGYDFLAAANGLFVDAAAETRLTDLYTRFTGERESYAAVAHQGKRDMMNDSFSSEVHMLAQSLKRVADKSRNARDFTHTGLLVAIRETMAAFPVYRSYVKREGLSQASDERHITMAIDLARQKNPRVEGSLFDFLRDVLLLREGGDPGAAFAMKFQQSSGPIMAKGVEDTAHYRYNRLVSLNEVGCNPARFGETIGAFHAHNARILSRWPLSMTTTSTHDTKRSEDVRSRLAVLSEVPDEWQLLVEQLDAATREVVGGLSLVSRTDAYVFYQTIVGALPFGRLEEHQRASFEERIAAYMQKAAREAKVTTSWATPNVAYEAALDTFVRAALRSVELMGLVTRFVERIAPHGASNSLAQVALRLAAPGVPDVYQGSEVWSLALVDPDNRAAVDFEAHRSLLAGLDGVDGKREPTVDLARELISTYADGRIKLYVTSKGLRLRRKHPALFLEGSYEPILVSEQVVAFERSYEGKRLICVVPRLSCSITTDDQPWALGGAWGDATLELRRPGTFQDVLTNARFEGHRFRLAEVLAAFPVAWLVSA